MLTNVHKCNIKKSVFPSGRLFPDFHRVYFIYHAGQCVPRFSNVNYRELHIFSAEITVLIYSYEK